MVSHRSIPQSISPPPHAGATNRGIVSAMRRRHRGNWAQISTVSPPPSGYPCKRHPGCGSRRRSRTAAPRTRSRGNAHRAEHPRPIPHAARHRPRRSASGESRRNRGCSRRADITHGKSVPPTVVPAQGLPEQVFRFGGVLAHVPRAAAVAVRRLVAHRSFPPLGPHRSPLLRILRFGFAKTKNSLSPPQGEVGAASASSPTINAGDLRKNQSALSPPSAGEKAKSTS